MNGQAAALALAVMWLLDDPAQDEHDAARIIARELLPEKIIDFGEEHGFGESVDYVRARDAHQQLLEHLEPGLDRSEWDIQRQLELARRETQKLINALTGRWTDHTVEEW